MMADRKWKKLAEEMRRPGTDCLSMEVLRKWIEEGELSTEIRRHLEGCVRCHIEARELRSFFVEPGPDEDVTTTPGKIRRRLEAVLSSPRSERPGPPPATKGRAWWPGANIMWPGLATAAAAVLAILVVPSLLEPDLLPIPTQGAGVVRSAAAVTSMVPQGLMSEVPAEFTWEAVGSARGPWQFTLERVDGTVIWSAQVVDTRVDLPERVREQLFPGSRYFWSLAPVAIPERTVGASFTLKP